jgi:hypothetical protein
MITFAGPASNATPISPSSKVARRNREVVGAAGAVPFTARSLIVIDPPVVQM